MNMDEEDNGDEDLFYKKYNAILKLKNRSVVSVTGEDAESFLQSMITNDMKQLKGEKVAIGALFLNPKGRILFDSFVVKSHL
jgi:folate-binding Fe-S cluster repair protein YgfZ